MTHQDESSILEDVLKVLTLREPEGLWERKRRRKAYRSRRRRRECFGELLQFDGSHHDWFEGRRSPCCLMNMVDDATGLTFSFFCEEETTSDAMRLLWRWIERYGIPQAKGRVERNHGVYQDRRELLDGRIKLL